MFNIGKTDPYYCQIYVPYTILSAPLLGLLA